MAKKERRNKKEKKLRNNKNDADRREIPFLSMTRF